MKLKTLSSRIIIFVAIIALAGSLTQALVSMSNIMGTMEVSAEQSLQGRLESATHQLTSWCDTQFAKADVRNGRARPIQMMLKRQINKYLKRIKIQKKI